MKKADNWMPLYIGDYMADTSHLTTEQHGAYLMLLMAMWKRGGSLPDVDENLAAATRLPVSRWKAIRPLLIDGLLLQADGTQVWQKRLLAEVEKAASITAARADAGSKGGANAQANRKQKVEANDNQSGEQNSTPSPSPSSLPTVEKIEGLRPSVDGAADRPALALVPSTPEVPDCPHQALIDLYAEHLPTLRQPLQWNAERQKAMRARWVECSRPTAFGNGYATQADGLAFWRKFFAYVAETPKLRDGIESREGGRVRVWKPDLPWLVNRSNFLKVIEGAFA